MSIEKSKSNMESLGQENHHEPFKVVSKALMTPKTTEHPCKINNNEECSYCIQILSKLHFNCRDALHFNCRDALSKKKKLRIGGLIPPALAQTQNYKIEKANSEYSIYTKINDV